MKREPEGGSSGMHLAFSTSWAGGDIERVASVLPHVDSLEIGSKGDRSFFRELDALIEDENIPVTSIHAVAYPDKVGKDAYYAPRLASLDSVVRMREMDEICRTAEWARSIDASALVIHTGKVEDAVLKQMTVEYENMVKAGTHPSDLGEQFHAIVNRRGRLSGLYVESIIEGLRYLCPRFPDLNFFIETRVHYYEIPLPDELQMILSRVCCRNLGYWHDIGHTCLLDRMGFIPMKVWQERFSQVCGGAHVHDMDEHLLDHYPPGEGILDVHFLLEQFDERVFLTLEINARNDFESVIRGIRYLRTDRICV
jgi:sugar phosphate isomerase/epimerase